MRGGSSTGIVDAKKTLRSEMKQWRDDLPQEVRLANSNAIWELFFAHAEVTEAKTIMLYASIRSEVNTKEALVQVLQHRQTLVLPRVKPGTLDIEAVEVSSLDDLVRGSYGILEPGPAAVPIPPQEIDVVGVPGLAFDLFGYRIGYGAGYYDRFLPSLRVDTMTVGIAFSGQVVPRVPREATDVPVRYIATEEYFVDTREV